MFLCLYLTMHGEIYDDFIIRHRNTSQTLPVWQLGLPTDPFWAGSSHTFPFYTFGTKKVPTLLLFLFLPGSVCE